MVKYLSFSWFFLLLPYDTFLINVLGKATMWHTHTHTPCFVVFFWFQGMMMHCGVCFTTKEKSCNYGEGGWWQHPSWKPHFCVVYKSLRQKVRGLLQSSSAKTWGRFFVFSFSPNDIPDRYPPGITGQKESRWMNDHTSHITILTSISKNALDRRLLTGELITLDLYHAITSKFR
jgi:hypothetical protein